MTYHALCPGSVRSASGEQNDDAGPAAGSPVVEALSALFSLVVLMEVPPNRSNMYQVRQMTNMR